MTIYLITRKNGIFTDVFTGFDFIGEPIFACLNVVNGLPAVPIYTSDMAAENALTAVQRFDPTAEQICLALPR